MTTPHKVLVLVADGHKLLFLRNEGDERYPVLRVEAHQELDNPASRDQASDGPGRALGNVGGARSSFEQTDQHQREEDRFAVEAAEQLRVRALAGDFDKLIVVAPPHMLGELRKHYHKEVEARLIDEIAKDLTDHSLPAIEAILKG